MRHRTSILVVALSLAAATVGITTAATHASASSQPTFTVMNTSETLPDGVWFRRSPHTADAAKVTGYGVYKNERVKLECYAWGDAVGPYANKLWYFVLNVTRPTNAGVSNSGYLNAHYINDGKATNQVDAGVAQCGAKSVFFSGTSDSGGGSGHQVASVDYPISALMGPPACALASGITMPPDTTTLAGWSGGRLGPIYLLKHANPAQYAAVHEIIFIDPGNSSDFVPCDADENVNVLLANWLKANPQNQLLVLTGLRSEEKSIFHEAGKSTFHGLWTYYFADIWNQSFANRALVCDYNRADHAQIMKDSWGVVQFLPDGCPILTHEALPVAWHP